MKEYKLFIDNAFRSPFHWNKCPIKNISKPRIYGLYIRSGEKMPTSLINRWFVVIYFHKWYRAWSNYPIIN
jgi:hypothetical protein